MATITKEKKAEIISQFGKSEKDTGNIRAQVAMLTERIVNLTEHVKVNKKDFHSTRGLTDMVAMRRRLLKYLATTDLEGYRELIKELGLRR
jgi:small subunit ribosomal protein S15